MFDWKIFQGKRTNNYPGGNIFEPPEDTPGQRIKIRQLVRFGQIVGVFNKILKEIFIAHVWVGKFFQNKRTNNGGNIFEPPGDTPGERIKIRQLVRFEQIVGMFDKILREIFIAHVQVGKSFRVNVQTITPEVTFLSHLEILLVKE